MLTACYPTCSAARHEEDSARDLSEALQHVPGLVVPILPLCLQFAVTMPVVPFTSPCL